MIRENSNTPNVTNMDDVRMVRYAYGGYNGFVKGKGRELACEANGNTLTINSGVIVIHGWEVEIDSNGWSMQVSVSDATTRYFTIYCEVNLSMGGTASIKSISDTANYPTVSAGDDLTKNTNGIARITLCQFIAQRGLISECVKTIQEIPYLCSQLEIMNQRLKEQGFREASVDNGEIVLNGDWADASIAGGYPEIAFVKSGKLVVLSRLKIVTKTAFEQSMSNWLKISSVIGKLADLFAPNEDIEVWGNVQIEYKDSHSTYYDYESGRIILHSNGEIEVRAEIYKNLFYTIKEVRVNFYGNGKYPKIQGSPLPVWIKNFGEEA